MPIGSELSDPSSPSPDACLPATPNLEGGALGLLWICSHQSVVVCW